MKRHFFAALSCAILTVVSCSEKETPTTDNVIEWNVPTGTVNAGETVTFADNSLNVVSRTWSFEDADPATSTQASVGVVFKSAGEKKVVLEVKFTDNFTLKEETVITVVNPILGELAVSSTTPMGCIKIGKEVTFSIDGLSGDPDSYSWTFEGGSPATSTDAKPKVTFDKRIRDAKITCTLTRSNDGATKVIEKSYIVGNYPVTRALPDYEIDNLCFEQKNLGGWIAWTNKGAAKNEIFSIAEGGANGTAHCLKVDVSQLTMEADGEFADLFPRDAWACNAHLEAGKTYELSYWVNGEGWAGDNKDTKWGTPTTQIINWLEDWMTVAGTDLSAGLKWDTIFPGKTFAAEPNMVLKEIWYPENGIGKVLDGWTNHTLQFTVAKDCHNAYPYFRVYTGQSSAVYFDEIEINLIEE